MSFIIPAEITRNATRLMEQAEYYYDEFGMDMPNSVMEAISDILPDVYSGIPMPCPVSTPRAWWKWFEAWRP